MANRTLDVEQLLSPHTTATTIANRFEQWGNLYRASWLKEKQELRNYVYATDTRTTGNKKLPWSNSTTTPKLTQIYDNLKANYMAALFPQRKWLRFEADGKDGSSKIKRDKIQTYMHAKLKQCDFEGVVADQLLDDWILTGNCFATIDYVNEVLEMPTGETVQSYVGPVLKRISPYDIAFDITASSFDETPKIVRSIKTLGEVENMIPQNPEYEGIFDKMMMNRSEVGSSTEARKSDGFIADGFSSLEQYYQSGFVEVLTFYGDLYDVEKREVKKNRIITVVDRAYVINDIPNPSWLKRTIFHSGWRSRPDNLMAMGPLDNLVGMQYRIDHLENLKADVFDQIALPMLKIKGDVEDFDYEPGGRVYIGEEGDVMPLVPETTALQADFQINLLQDKMEELAGAPRQAMGIRTPGEKTAFEVDSLMNAANRIFEHKIEKFEREFLEPAINAMLAAARKNLNYEDVVSTLDDETGYQIFMSITADDLAPSGKIRALGARHFKERNRRVQNLNNVMQIKMADPSVGVHLSGKQIAKLLAEELDEPDLYRENVGIEEQTETQAAASDAEAMAQEELETKAELGL